MMTSGVRPMMTNDDQAGGGPTKDDKEISMTKKENFDDNKGDVEGVGVQNLCHHVIISRQPLTRIMIVSVWVSPSQTNTRGSGRQQEGRERGESIFPFCKKSSCAFLFCCRRLSLM